MRRLTEGTPEFPAEVGLREARSARDLRDVERLAVARVDEVFRPQQVPRWVRRSHFATRYIVSSCVVLL